MDSILWQKDAKRWYEASRRRVSIRRYSGAPTGEQRNVLAALAKTLSLGGVRIVMLPVKARVFGHGLMGRSIKGAQGGAAFVLAKGTPDWCAGYAGEAFILECTALELGSCWLVGTFNHKRARLAADLRDGERLVAVTPVGVAKEGIPEPVSDDDRRRKTIPKLTGLSDKAFENLPEWQRNIILCLRSAPSAMNRQPWRFAPTRNGFLLHAKKPSLDTGIAMFHLEMAMAAHGKRGTWSEEKEKGSWVFSMNSE
ncbi:MAG: hypothetical protein FWE59_03760 [Oscillospiraceae bacterium]|nr:hypothetical protein [Oscillospiraceae bacterium]